MLSFILLIIVLIYCSALCSCTVFNLSHNKIQCSPTVFVHNILIIFDFSTTLLLHYGASSMKLSPPWLHNSTEHPKLIYMKISISSYIVGRICLKCYRLVLVASEIDNGLRHTQFWLDWPKSECLLCRVDKSDSENVLKKNFWQKLWVQRPFFCFCWSHWLS